MHYLLKPIFNDKKKYAIFFPIVWISHKIGLNNKINNLQERALRDAYQEKKSF